MKKFIYLLVLAVLPLSFLSSCGDDDDMPDVDFKVAISGGVDIDGIIYVVQGDALTVGSVYVINKEPDKAAIITSAAYFWDYRHIGTTVMPPYGFVVQTTDKTGIGDHSLEIECPLYAVDKAAATALLGYRVRVVASSDDIPTGDASYSFITTPRMKTE